MIHKTWINEGKDWLYETTTEKQKKKHKIPNTSAIPAEIFAVALREKHPAVGWMLWVPSNCLETLPPSGPVL